MIPRLYLFDIDGTLIRSGGAGRKAMDRAFTALHGISGAFEAVDFRGTLDVLVLEAVYGHHGLAVDAAAQARFLEAYLPCLEEELCPGQDPAQVTCPGVQETLSALEARGPLGLVTGNWREGARRKLSAFGLWDRFSFGGFGEDGRDRADLVAVAVERARQLGWPARQAVHVGDTPQDVAAARAAGALAVAVCTGWHSREALEAAGPDLLVADLETGLPALLAL